MYGKNHPPWSERASGCIIMEHHRYGLYALEHRPGFNLRGIEIPVRQIVVVPLKMATPDVSFGG